MLLLRCFQRNGVLRAELKGGCAWYHHHASRATPAEPPPSTVGWTSFSSSPTCWNSASSSDFECATLHTPCQWTEQQARDAQQGTSRAKLHITVRDATITWLESSKEGKGYWAALYQRATREIQNSLSLYYSRVEVLRRGGKSWVALYQRATRKAQISLGGLSGC